LFFNLLTNSKSISFVIFIQNESRMDEKTLKQNIIQQIIDIDDIETLKTLQYILSEDNLEHLTEVMNDPTKTENFNDYIKEWVKNM